MRIGGRLDSPYLTQSVVPGPVGLVVVRTAAGVNAMTVSLFSEVAHYPTSMWMAIAPETLTHAMLLLVRRFSFITLHAKQRELAVACGTVSGRVSNKCAGLGLYEHRDGFLFLRDALASTACTIERGVPEGDHTLFLCNLVSGDITGRRTAQRQLLLSDLRGA